MTDYETWCLHKQGRNEEGLWWLIRVLYTQCEDAQENLERDDVEDVFSRQFFCHHLTMQHWLVLSCFKAICMQSFIFVGSLL